MSEDDELEGKEISSSNLMSVLCQKTMNLKVRRSIQPISCPFCARRRGIGRLGDQAVALVLSVRENYLQITDTEAFADCSESRRSVNNSNYCVKSTGSRDCPPWRTP